MELEKKKKIEKGQGTKYEYAAAGNIIRGFKLPPPPPHVGRDYNGTVVVSR